jgi:hypothetical protein
MKFKGNVLQHGRPIARDISINVRIHGARFHGELLLPKGANISSGAYELQLKDRRTGRITITTVEGETAYFDGDGALKKQ